MTGFTTAGIPDRPASCRATVPATIVLARKAGGLPYDRVLAEALAWPPAPTWSPRRREAASSRTADRGPAMRRRPCLRV